MKHPSELKEYTMEELARGVGNLRYDALEDFLDQLSSKLFRDAIADDKRGRYNLSDSLLAASRRARDSSASIKKAWKISEPFM